MFIHSDARIPKRCLLCGSIITELHLIEHKCKPSEGWNKKKERALPKQPTVSEKKESTKWYCYRNPMTGDEVKREEPMSLEEMQNTGYELMNVYDWSVSEKEKKCK